MELETIVFAAGCFWGVEKYFSHIDNVIEVNSGYAGGSYKNPTYEIVLEHRDSNSIINHTEAVIVKYDKSKIDLKNLIISFWELHNPTQGNQQGNDIGNNYRSAIYYTTDEQKYIALATKDIYEKLLLKNGYPKITTEIKELDEFYLAEDYHQNYLEKNPTGYCPNHSIGVKYQDTNKEYYKQIGKYKLGEDSEAYHIAFNNGTEHMFCKQYDIFKDTPDGYFIDIVSGEKLFDTKDRFNSGSGWLSFYDAVEDSTVELTDTSHGMTRVEVRSKKSDIHLGHVFPMENGKRRYCINANVLEFKTK